MGLEMEIFQQDEKAVFCYKEAQPVASTHQSLIQYFKQRH